MRKVNGCNLWMRRWTGPATLLVTRGDGHDADAYQGTVWPYDKDDRSCFCLQGQQIVQFFDHQVSRLFYVRNPFEPQAGKILMILLKTDAHPKPR